MSILVRMVLGFGPLVALVAALVFCGQVVGESSSSTTVPDLASIHGRGAAAAVRSVNRLPIPCTDGDDIVVLIQEPDGAISATVNGRPCDYVWAQRRGLSIVAGAGDDVVVAEAGLTCDLAVDAGPGDDHVTTGAGDDVVFGGPGRDVIHTGEGRDLVDAGPGADTVALGSGDDGVDGSGGADELSGGDGRDYVEGGPGDDALSGGPGDDVLYGLTGDDRLAGDDGVDYLDGGLGDDALRGTGDDMLFSGEPADPPTDERGWSVVVIDDDAGSRDRVESDLAALGALPEGRSLLDALTARGRAVEIAMTDCGSAVEFAVRDDGFLRENGRPGPGTDVRIRYNPYRMVVGDGSADWERRPPVVALYHELVHALNAASGTLQPGSDWGAGASRLQYQAIGLPQDGLPFDGDGDPGTAASRDNPVEFTENGIRAALGLPLRTDP